MAIDIKQKPDQVVRLRNGLVALQWGKHDVMVCQQLGGLCFPRDFNENRTPEGFACVMLQELDTGTVFVPMSTKFITLDPLRTDDGTISDPGSVDWFNSAWSKWYCHRWWVCDPMPIFERWVTMMENCAALKPKPQVELIKWGENSQAILTVKNMADRQKLVCPPGSEAHTALRLFESDKPPSAGIQAMASAIIGGESENLGVKRKPPRKAKPVKYPYT